MVEPNSLACTLRFPLLPHIERDFTPLAEQLGFAPLRLHIQAHFCSKNYYSSLPYMSSCPALQNPVR